MESHVTGFPEQIGFWIPESLNKYGYLLHVTAVAEFISSAKEIKRLSSLGAQEQVLSLEKHEYFKQQI